MGRSLFQGVALVTLTPGLVLGAVAVGHRERETPLDRSLRNWAAARARWDQAGLLDYRVLVQWAHVTGRCLQEIDVRAGRIAAILRNECEAAPMTVPGYFDHIHQQIPGSRCPDSACKCAVVYRVEMTCAAIGGHPRTIQLTADSYEINTDSDDYWQREALGLAPVECTAAMLFATSPVTILDITPRSSTR